MRVAIGTMAGAALAALVGCGGQSPDAGLNANLRATGAQFVPGPLPTKLDPNGPTTQGYTTANTNIRPGLTGMGFTGTVIGGATVIFGLVGDSGYWIVPAPIADPLVMDGYTFSTSLSFSPDMPRQAQTLALYGVAPDGTIGPQATLALSVPPAIPPGALVFSLNWDTNADLDLHLVMPDPMQDPSDPTLPATIEVWAKAPTALPPNSAGWDDATVATAGKLDFDSNANCVIDGRRQENIIFPAGTTPPSGHYIVRVETFSMCGQAAAQWRVDVTTPNGPFRNPATWESTDADARPPHGLGAGRLALDFDYP
jgi:hypothetical protein